jgi:diaminohydroxyphosphoribosylaminopyrimidine deaminase/5-amino-6-(5-phosphoribosylamino)uracil reductase
MAEVADTAWMVGRDEWAAVNATGRPYVVYKVAATLDGRVAAADGSSRWVTGEASRAEVHRLRAACHATVVGSGTQQADDPHLTVRSAEVGHQPLRVVVDSDARTPAGARVLDGSAPTVLVVAADAGTGHLGGTDLLRVPRTAHGLDLDAMLKGLHDRGVAAILLEGGPTLAGSFLRAGLVDRVIDYVAPKLLGAGRAALGDAGVGTMADAVRLELLDVAPVGTDVRIVARPLRPA